MGSVKDLKILKMPTHDKLGQGRFIFSDRYSVFDWGEMPDHINNKGAAIALLGAYFFEKLEKMNIPTHYVGLVENGFVKKLSEIKNSTNVMEIKLLQVIKPEFKGDKYDYSTYLCEKGVRLIPLEVIYRNVLPPGSSIFKRLKEGELTCQQLGLNGMPLPNQILTTPILEVSTKLEITDRYVTWSEAEQISGLSQKEITKLKDLTTIVNDLITEEFSKIGLMNEDGKIEVGFDNKLSLMLVDVLGTLDECRFTYKSLPVSKEIARMYYRKTAWYQAVEEAKRKDRQHWKNICTLSPEPMPPKLKLLFSQIYCACTNEVTGKNWFKDVPSLKDVLNEIEEMIQT